MKLGSNDIIKMYLGLNQLTSNNAFIGEVPLIYKPEPGPTDNRLRLEAVENSTFSLMHLSSVSTVQYSLDGTNWNDVRVASDVSLNAGETVYLRGKITGNLTNSDYTQFAMTGNIVAKGNIMYLYDYENPDSTTITYEYAFRSLFNGCSSLSDISELYLPATTLSPSCYRQMFTRCTLITKAPELPAAILPTYAYSGMFDYCSNLNYIKCMATNISASSCTSNWVRSVASSGTFICDATTSWQTNSNNGIPNGWSKVGLIDFPEPTVQFNPADSLKFTAKEDALFGLTRKNNAYTLYFSKDNENWGQLTTVGVFEVKNNDVIYVCGNLTNNQSYGTNNTNFSITGRTTVEGSINSLWDYATLNDTTYKYACYRMFENCTGLLNTPTLPATTLTEAAYAGMFKGCTGLTTTPSLPATSLYRYDYVAMFMNCSGLTSIQDFPTYITKSNTTTSFASMFEGCSSLTDLSTLRLPLLENNTAPCFSVYNFSSSNISSDLGIVTSRSTSFNKGGMFKNCTSLVSAPVLPATTLTAQCYDSMFSGCSSLVNAPELPATTLTSDCYSGMFAKCSSLVNAPELPATTLANYCYWGMFAECTSLTTAPELPATTLANYCYSYMFWWSRNVNYIKCLAEDISATSCTNYWVTSVASTGTFVKAASMASWTTGENGIPSGWTIENYIPPTPAGPPNDEIWYTSSDGNIVTPYYNGALPTISNTYSDGKGIFKFASDVTNIGNWALAERGNLTSVTIPNSVTRIGDDAFIDCGSLTSIEIPNGVTYIGENAIRDCTSLSSISYDGTIAQWSSVSKGTSWRFNVPATVVHCTDGDAPI